MVEICSQFGDRKNKTVFEGVVFWEICQVCILHLSSQKGMQCGIRQGGPLFELDGCPCRKLKSKDVSELSSIKIASRLRPILRPISESD
jgi:hypothetical protein